VAYRSFSQESRGSPFTEFVDLDVATVIVRDEELKPTIAISVGVGDRTHSATEFLDELFIERARRVGSQEVSRIVSITSN